MLKDIVGGNVADRAKNEKRKKMQWALSICTLRERLIGTRIRFNIPLCPRSGRVMCVQTYYCVSESMKYKNTVSFME